MIDKQFIWELMEISERVARRNERRVERRPSLSALHAAQTFLDEQKPRFRLAAELNQRAASFVRIDCRDRTLCETTVEVEGIPAFYSLCGEAFMLAPILVINGFGVKQFRRFAPDPNKCMFRDEAPVVHPNLQSPLWGSPDGEPKEWVEIIASW